MYMTRNLQLHLVKGCISGVNEGPDRQGCLKIQHNVTLQWEPYLQ